MRAFLSQEVARSSERFRLSHKGLVCVSVDEPLQYHDAQWSTMAVFEIFDIPPGQTIKDLNTAIIRAGGIEIFKYRQRVSFQRLMDIYLPPADFVEERPDNELVWRQWRAPQGWHKVELIDGSDATWERYCALVAAKGRR